MISVSLHGKDGLSDLDAALAAVRDVRRLGPADDEHAAAPSATLRLSRGGPVARQIDVVGAVIVNDGLVLCAQRGAHGALAGLWEFPGGKIKPPESARDALEREISEELRCVVEVGDEVTTTSHEYDFGLVTLTTFFCRLVQGEPNPVEHESIRWMSPAELDGLAWAPADIPAVAAIRAQFAP